MEQSRRDILGADVYGRMRSPWNVNDRKYLTRGLGEMCGDLSTDFCEYFFLCAMLLNYGMNSKLDAFELLMR